MKTIKIFNILFFYTVFKIQCIFYCYCASQFRLATFRALNNTSNKWLPYRVDRANSQYKGPKGDACRDSI